MSDRLYEKFQAVEGERLWAQVIAHAPFMFQAARCLRDFGILKAIDDSPNGIQFPELQAKIDLSEYSLKLLLDSGESIGLVSKKEDRFTLTLSGGYVLKDKLTNVNMNFSQDVCYQGLFDLDKSLATNEPAGLKVFGNWSTIYEGLTQLPEKVLKSWLDFDHFYSDDVFPRVLPIVFKDQPRTLLDVGGNTGKFALACCDHDPNVVVTILDHPNQLKLAKQNAEAKGFGERVNGHATNLLDHTVAFPKNPDVIWMSQFLDCFGKDDILELLKRARAAMNETSHLFIMEPFVDKQRYPTSEFCLNMMSLYFTAMANGKSRFYPCSDFYELVQAAGLEVIEEISPIRLSHTILKCRIPR